MAFLGFLGLITYTTSEVLGFAFVCSIVISFVHLYGFASALSFKDRSFWRYCGRWIRHVARYLSESCQLTIDGIDSVISHFITVIKMLNVKTVRTGLRNPTAPSSPTKGTT